MHKLEGKLQPFLSNSVIQKPKLSIYCTTGVVITLVKDSISNYINNLSLPENGGAKSALKKHFLVLKFLCYTCIEFRKT